MWCSIELPQNSDGSAWGAVTNVGTSADPSQPRTVRTIVVNAQPAVAFSDNTNRGQFIRSITDGTTWPGSSVAFNSGQAFTPRNFAVAIQGGMLSIGGTTFGTDDGSGFARANDVNGTTFRVVANLDGSTFPSMSMATNTGDQPFLLATADFATDRLRGQRTTDYFSTSFPPSADSTGISGLILTPATVACDVVSTLIGIIFGVGSDMRYITTTDGLGTAINNTAQTISSTEGTTSYYGLREVGAEPGAAWINDGTAIRWSRRNQVSTGLTTTTTPTTTTPTTTTTTPTTTTTTPTTTTTTPTTTTTTPTTTTTAAATTTTAPATTTTAAATTTHRSRHNYHRCRHNYHRSRHDYHHSHHHQQQQLDYHALRRNYNHLHFNHHTSRRRFE